MRFFDSTGKAVRASSQPANRQGYSEQDVSDHIRLCELLRELQARVGRLEAKSPPEAAEYVLDVGSGGALTRLYHGFNGSVRWYVCHWSGPSSSWELVQDDLSDPNNLVLRSYAPGRCVLRVEPSQFPVT